MTSFGSGFGAAAVANHNPNKDVEITAPPDDSISSLAFSPNANLLVATSWDNQVRGCGCHGAFQVSCLVCRTAARR